MPSKITEIRSKAMVLKKAPFRENDLIVDLLLEQDGIIKAIAFGAASNRSSRGRCSQPFRELSIYLHKQTNPINQQANYRMIEINEPSNITLLPIESNRTTDSPSGFNHTLLACANYVNECYLHLATQFEPIQQSYHLYLETLKNLQTATDHLSINRTLREFELQILCFLGYDIRHIHQQIKNTTPSNTHYCYDLHNGWQIDINQTQGLNWQSCQNLHDLTTLDQRQLKCLQKHNQRLLNELSHYKIQASRDWLKSFYSGTHN